jgi:DNA-cytosine methyltransferase
MRHGSLFSGIGGFDLAAEWMGWDNVFHCEWNEFGQKVLHHYWPNAIQYNDITQTDFTIHRGHIDILTGGFPCQPYSMAGKRKGKEDERHLWPQMCRAIREIQPRWVVGENVLGLVNWSGGLVFHEVQADLEAAGYEVWPYVLPAVSVGAPHRRDRIWFVAHSKDIRWNGRECKFREKINQDATRFCQHRQERSQMGTEPERHSKEWIATDTDRIRLEQCEDSGEMGRGQTEMGGQGSKLTNAFKTDGEVANAADSNRNGLNQRNGNDEKQPGEGGFNALGNADTGNEYGDAADTDNARADIGMRTERERQTEDNGWEEQSFSQHRSDGKYGDAADTTSERFCGDSSREQSQSSTFGTRNRMGKWDAADTGLLGQTKRQQQSMGSKQLCEERDAADSMLPRGGKDNRRGKSKFFDENGKIGNWETFPTQSPVCSGDDGIPTKLDGITFSKWRNESIKGYGNAIVPQVVYQIFKAIEEYERSTNPARHHPEAHR